MAATVDQKTSEKAVKVKVEPSEKAVDTAAETVKAIKQEKAADVEVDAKIKPDETVEAAEPDTAEAKEDDDDAARKDDGPPIDVDEALKMTVKLSDDTEACIFSRGPKYSEDVWPINCHLCRMGNIVHKDRLKFHLNSKRHQSVLAKGPPDAKKYMEPYRQRTSRMPLMDKPISILPGEIITEITDDLKDRIVAKTAFRKPEDQAILKELNDEPVHRYNKQAPILGLSYVLKFKKGVKITYFCCLCNTEVHGEAYQHFVGANHQAKYIVKHFPTLYEKVIQQIGTVSTGLQQKYVRRIFRKIYQKIEKAKGLRKIIIIDGEDWKSKRTELINTVRDLKHYDENVIRSLDVDAEKLTARCLKDEEIIKPDLISLNNPNEGVRDRANQNRLSFEQQRLLEEEVKQKALLVAQLQMQQQHQQQIAFEQEQYYREQQMAQYGKRSRGRSPLRGGPALKTIRGNEGNRLDDPADWQRYRLAIGNILDELQVIYESYEREPESHPLYEVEWKKFWRIRTRELEQDNVDPRFYDLKKEWVPYWLQQLQEYHAKEVGKRKFDLKRQLRLSFNARSPSPIRQRRSQPILPSRAVTPPGYRVQHQIAQQRNVVQNVPVEEVVDPAPTEPLSVISVLRLLTALEDQLGSLGPKAVQLLSRAVLFEKNNQNPNELLLESEFYVFFMTSKEKLKGQILANIVEPNKARAVKRAASDLNTILAMFEEYCARQNINPRTLLASAQSATESSSNTRAAVGGGGGNQFGGGGSNSGSQYGGVQQISDRQNTTRFDSNRFGGGGSGGSGGNDNQFSGGRNENQFSGGRGNENANQRFGGGGGGRNDNNQQFGGRNDNNNQQQFGGRNDNQQQQFGGGRNDSNQQQFGGGRNDNNQQQQFGGGRNDSNQQQFGGRNETTQYDRGNQFGSANNTSGGRSAGGYGGVGSTGGGGNQFGGGNSNQGNIKKANQFAADNTQQFDSNLGGNRGGAGNQFGRNTGLAGGVTNQFDDNQQFNRSGTGGNQNRSNLGSNQNRSAGIGGNKSAGGNNFSSGQNAWQGAGNNQNTGGRGTNSSGVGNANLSSGNSNNRGGNNFGLKQGIPGYTQPAFSSSSGGINTGPKSLIGLDVGSTPTRGFGGNNSGSNYGGTFGGGNSSGSGGFGGNNAGSGGGYGQPSSNFGGGSSSGGGGNAGYSTGNNLGNNSSNFGSRPNQNQSTSFNNNNQQQFNRSVGAVGNRRNY